MAGGCDIDIRVEHTAGSMVLLSPAGILDSASYLMVRTALVKAAVEEPTAVLIDVDELIVPAASAWSVLTSAQWMVSAWPAVPICGVTTRPTVHATLVANRIIRWVPFFHSREAAVAAVATGNITHCYRLCALRQLPRHAASQAVAREFIHEFLLTWSHPEYLHAAEAVASELIRNVLAHTQSAPRIRLELDGDRLIIAVADESPKPAVRQEPAGGTLRFSGLGVVSTLSRVWGCHPTGTGKVVWAVIEPVERPAVTSE